LGLKFFTFEDEDNDDVTVTLKVFLNYETCKEEEEDVEDYIFSDSDDFAEVRIFYGIFFLCYLFLSYMW